jgi:transposase
MAKPLVSDVLWEAIAPLLPPEPPKPKGGRPRVPDRAALTGIIFVLRTGLPWEYLPQELGCGSGVTCWRRLREWEQAGVWHRLHLILLDRLGEADKIDWSRASLDASSIPAKRGAVRTRRSAPTRPTVAKPARSGTSWWTARASHSQFGSPRPTSMTRSSSKT